MKISSNLYETCSRIWHFTFFRLVIDRIQKIWRVHLLSTFCDGKSGSRTTLCGGGAGVSGIFTEIIGWLFASHEALGLPCCHSNPSAIFFSAAGTISSMEFESVFTVSSSRKWLLVLTILLIPWYVRQMPNKQQLKDCISISFKSRFWECSSVENVTHRSSTLFVGSLSWVHNPGSLSFTS